MRCTPSRSSAIPSGAIERRPGRDRRTNALHLTAAGETLRERIEQETLAHDQEAFAGLTAAERAEFSRLLAKLRSVDARLEPA